MLNWYEYRMAVYGKLELLGQKTSENDGEFYSEKFVAVLWEGAK